MTAALAAPIEREKKKGGGRQCALVLLFSHFFSCCILFVFLLLLLELLLPRYLRYNTRGRRRNVVQRETEDIQLAFFFSPSHIILTFSSSFLHIFFPFSIFLTKLEEFLPVFSRFFDG